MIPYKTKSVIIQGGGCGYSQVERKVLPDPLPHNFMSLSLQQLLDDRKELGVLFRYTNHRSTNRRERQQLVTLAYYIDNYNQRIKELDPTRR